MKTNFLQILFQFFACCCCLHSVLAGESNHLPTISLVWPNRGFVFGDGTLLRLKAVASDPDGSVTQVQFFANTYLIGTVTNPPYNITWWVGSGGAHSELSAIAIDDSGASNRSARVVVVASKFRPPGAFIDILSPSEGAILAAASQFEVVAETLASPYAAGPLELFELGSNLLGASGEAMPLQANTQPVSITVSNLSEGKHQLYMMLDFNYVGGVLRTIQVVKLATHTPRLTVDGRAQFEVVTSFPNQPNVIEASPNLRDWTALSTNFPANNYFTYTDAAPTTEERRYYRVRVPPP